MNLLLKDPNSNNKLIKRVDDYVSTNGIVFPIVNNIPRFVNTKNYTDTFGLQWNSFTKIQLDSNSGFSLTEQRLKRCLGDSLFLNIEGKKILEAGCGAGRFTEILLENNARVVSVDMSSAVDANQENFPQNENHIIAQADICKLPFKEEQFDLVICLGVIQHTKNPRETLMALYSQLKPGGWLILDHYMFSLSHASQVSKIFFRFFLKRLNPKLSLIVTNYLVTIFLPLHRVGRRSRIWQAIMRRITPVVSYYNDFPHLSDEIQKEWSKLDTFDNLTDYYKHLTTIKKFKRSIKKLGAKNIKVWRGGIGIEARCMKPYSN
jgi:2-polyprenyl-3-methyl-5-hydroxy-6-metoxy-1,4-benzoquinol methylase